MKSKTSLFTGIILAILVVGSFSSCKKCTVAETDTNTGEIITTAIVYPKVGYMSENGNYFTGANINADNFEVSFDGGKTKGPVDWGTYSILANPQMVNCKASFSRDVTFDDINDLVLYTVTATTCESCTPERYVENFILIPNVPAGYSVYFDSDVITN